MLKKVISAGLIGGLTLIIWAILINGFFGFKYSIDMKKVPNQPQVYQILKENITEPGRYLCNPALTESNMFPENQPVFSILYGGMGHEAAGPISVILDFLYAFLTATLCAWLLSLTSEKIISSYPRKVFFVLLIGLLFAFFSDIKKYGIGNYPLNDTLIMTFHNIILWIVLGLVISLFIKPIQKKTV
ncbi:TPA: DUF1761 family protein [bacterium]|nr:DUF1761 family protein [bacterium]